MSHSPPPLQTPLYARVLSATSARTHARTHRQTDSQQQQQQDGWRLEKERKTRVFGAINDGAVGGGRSRVRRGGHPQASHSKGGTARGGGRRPPLSRVFSLRPQKCRRCGSAQRRFRARELSFCAARLYPPLPLPPRPFLTTEASQLGATCTYSTCPSSR